MKINNKAVSMMSLAAKAGKVTSGEFSVEKAVKEGIAELVIISEEASDNTKKKFANMCNYHKVEYRVYGDKDTLGHNIGKQMRATIAILDKGFAKAILENLPEDEVLG